MSWRVQFKGVVGALQLDVHLEGTHGPLALIGPNGSGKTSVLRAIAGAVPLMEGHIEIDGAVLYSAKQSIDVPSEARGLGYVPQGYGLFPHLSVIENVAFGLSTGPKRRPRQQRMSAALKILEDLESAHLSGRKPQHLSGGERQRVALARALVVQPNLLLLDEPLAALDATARRAVRTFLAARLRALKLPSIVVTHDVRDVQALGAEVCVLDDGKIVQCGTLETIRANPSTEFAAEFVGPSL